MLAGGVRRNDGRHPELVQRVDQMDRIVGRVLHDGLHRQPLKQIRGPFDIAGLPERQFKAGQMPESLDQCVNLGTQSTA